MVAYLFPGQGRDSGQLQTDIFQKSIGFYRSMLDVKERRVIGGLSLGEFGALFAAKVLNAEVCNDLLSKRQILMDRACIEYPGSMAAIIGMEVSQLEEICEKVGGVVIANFNSPKQLVVSGESAAVSLVIAQVTQSRAKAIKLKVTGAFHSPLMDGACAEFAKVLEQVTFTEPIKPFYSSVSGERVDNAETIKSLLSRQMNSPVLFEKMVRNMQHDGATEFVEIGTTGVINRMLPDIIGHGVG